MSRERRIMLVGVAVLCGTLAIAIGGCFAILGWDGDVVRAVAFAAVITGGGAVTGWILARQGRGGALAVAVAGGLTATLVRVLPLLVALAWLMGDQAAWKRVAAGLLVAFHLVLLLADVAINSLADWLAGQDSPRPENGPSAGADRGI